MLFFIELLHCVQSKTLFLGTFCLTSCLFGVYTLNGDGLKRQSSIYSREERGGLKDGSREDQSLKKASSEKQPAERDHAVRQVELK